MEMHLKDLACLAKKIKKRKKLQASSSKQQA